MNKNEHSYKNFQAASRPDVAAGTTDTQDGKGPRQKNRPFSSVYHSYDGFGREISNKTVYPNGDTESSATSYNKNGSMVSATDKDGITTTNTYDKMNKVVRTRLTGGGKNNVTTTEERYTDIMIHTWKGKKKIRNVLLTTNTDPEGNRSFSYVDKMGRQVRNISGGIITDTSYSLDGMTICTISLPTREDPLHHGTWQVEASAYDNKGNTVASVTNPSLANGRIRLQKTSILTTSAYDDNGHLIAAKDELGAVTKYEYGTKEKDKLTKVVLPDGSATSFRYDDLWTETVDANGNISVAYTNDRGEQTSVVDYGTSKSDKSQIATKSSYDAKGRLSKLTYENGAYETYRYDGKGRQIAVGHYLANGQLDFSTDIDYDKKDRIGTKIDYAGGRQSRRTEYKYDVFGRVTSVSERDIATGQMNTYRYSYDQMDRVTKILYPVKKEDSLKGVTYSYGRYGRLSRVGLLTGNGMRTLRTYRYDKWGRVAKMTDALDPEHGGDMRLDKTYHYDRLGHVASIDISRSSDPDTVIERYSYAYDKKSQILQETIWNAGAKRSERRKFSYDKLGRLTNTVFQEGLPEANDLDGALKDYVASLHVLPPGALLDAWDKGYPWPFDVDGDYITVREKSYGYDKVGNRLREEEKAVAPLIQKAKGRKAAETATKTSTFGEFNQLLRTEISAGERNTAVDYTYDSNGNQISETLTGKAYLPSPVTGSALEAATQSAVQQEDIVLSKTVNSYDSANRLTRTTISENETLVSATENRYDGDGQRTQKIVTEGAKAPAATNYFYQDGVVSFTTDGGGNVTSRNIIGNASNIISTKRYQGKYVGQLYNYAKDDQGSVMSIYDPEGSFITGYDYDDFGQTEQIGDASFYNEVCYTGGIYDVSTSLYYLNARYYDPIDGRFLTLDTYLGDMNQPNTLHLYAYCANNPVNFIDPSGHKYRPNVGVAYAKKYWNGSNPELPDMRKYGGNDCTNFVSQCIWYSGKYAQGLDLSIENEKAWYCKSDWETSGIESTVSRSWRGARKFRDFWESRSGKYSEIKFEKVGTIKKWKKESKKAKLSIGDAVIFTNQGGDPHHTVFITTKYENGDYGYAAHNNDHFYKRLWKAFHGDSDNKGEKLLVFHMNNKKTTPKPRVVP